MKILSLDTTTGICSVAVFNDGKIIAEKIEQGASKQAERIVPMVEEILLENKLGYKDFSHFVCTMGPGSFTGVRIGMSAIKGMAIASKIPLIGVNTLETICYSTAIKHKGKILSVLNALRGEVYAQMFDSKNIKPITEPQLINIENLESFGNSADVIAGNCPEIVGDIFTGKIITEKINPSAGAASCVAAIRIADNKAEPANPLYIRKPDAKKPAA